MTSKQWLLGPSYAMVQRILSGEIRIDPQTVPTRVFEALNSDRPSRLRASAAAAYWMKAELHYRARRALSIAEHYDLPVEFYRLFLDDDYSAYSCAVWDNGATTLETAQRRKLELLARKLDAKPGHRILDVGCGWGSFLAYARERGLEAEGLTLSRRQVEECRRIGLRAGYGDAAEEVPAPVDRIVSAGMMEHCKNQRDRILANCYRTLVRGGRMVVQEICKSSERGNLPAVVFVAEEFFPGDRIGSYISVQHAARRAGFQVHHLEGFGRHYVRTTREWARRLAERFDEAVGIVGYRTAMTYLLCFSGYAWYFDVGAIDLIQYILVKPD
jgi:cyclopropane-fatty-acyl-phospholipid synthase